MGTKVKELNNLKDGDRNLCSICNPPDPKKYVSAASVWDAVKKYGGRSHRGS